MNTNNYQLSPYVFVGEAKENTDITDFVISHEKRIMALVDFLKINGLYSDINAYNGNFGVFDKFVNENFSTQNINFWRSLVLDMFLLVYKTFNERMEERTHFSIIEEGNEKFLGFAIFDEPYNSKNTRSLVDVVNIEKASIDYLGFLQEYGYVQRNFNYYVTNLIKSRYKMGLYTPRIPYSLSAAKEGMYDTFAYKKFIIL